MKTKLSDNTENQKEKTMPKHQMIAIEFSDMLDRVKSDSDTPWREVIGLNDETLDRLESELAGFDRDLHGEEAAGKEDGLLAAIDAREDELLSNLKHTWWNVTWPEHVLSPRYNSDASYRQCRSREEALDGAVEYGS